MSRPIALATSDTSAPVASQIALMALMLEIRCARKALAACRKYNVMVIIQEKNKSFKQGGSSYIHVHILMHLHVHVHCKLD